ncbi:MAG: PD-(D/E)XK nuclease family transposase, partial [Bacteroidales bacterium]|nr:PD-(D/E)XK nuclease family transposase [Bacteroidales bacterium]
EKYTIIFIELRKFTKDLDDISPDNMQEVFIHCLKNMHRHKKQPETLQQPICNRLFEAARFAAMNKQERQAYISKMNTERDLRNQLDYARSEGLAKGRKEALTESARKFKAQNVPIEVISSCTGLSVEEIMAL